uniref:Uncharacterized protein n=1 Tax=Cacopsylla melanoneura TaxID=428564 RepID=A0A8D8ZQK3_9HEMI
MSFQISDRPAGHSFLPCDRDFALIEKSKKKSAAMVPADWKCIIEGASITNPYIVREMQQTDFKDFEPLVTKIFIQNPQFQITKFAWYKMCSDDPSSVLARESHQVNKPWKLFKLFRDEEGESEPPQLYRAPLPITKDKKKDLLKMTEYLRSQEHVDFYKGLPSQ